jgi:hypothetical protein
MPDDTISFPTKVKKQMRTRQTIENNRKLSGFRRFLNLKIPLLDPKRAGFQPTTRRPYAFVCIDYLPIFARQTCREACRAIAPSRNRTAGSTTAMKNPSLGLSITAIE